MFKHGFPPEWSTFKKLIWLVGTGIAGAASGIWKTVTGTLIHITDALASPMQKCEVTLEPIQDLHGQDAPYPAGGGKNKWNPTTVATPEGTSNGITYTKNADGSYSFNGTATASTWFNFGNITLPSGTWTASVTKEGAYTGTISFGAAAGVFITYPNMTTYPRTETSAEETTGNFGINFSNGAVVTNLRLWFQIETGSTATPWSPYSNICPITGWTGCEATRTGKNLLNPENVLTSTYVNGGKIASHNTYNLYYAPIKENTDYTFYQNDAGGYPVIAFCNDAPSLGVSTTSEASLRNRNVYTFNSGSYKYVLFALYKSSGTTNWLSLGETTSDPYTEYQGTTLSVTFPDGQTVYGGTVDLVSGVLTVDRAIKTLDGTNIYSATDYGSNYRGTFDVIGIEKAAGTNYNSINKKMKASNCFVNSSPHSASSATKFSISYMGYNSERVLVVAIGISSYADFATYMNNNPIQLVYPLAEPIEIQLTPQQISTLKGENNVWSNANGETTLIYKAQAE